jgi:hypothetical protein
VVKLSTLVARPSAAMPPTTASKKSISNEQWEAKLASVKVAKADMNKLVMNFLVTEVNQRNSSAPAQSSSSWQKCKGTLVLQQQQGLFQSCCQLHAMSRLHSSEYGALKSNAMAVHAADSSLQRLHNDKQLPCSPFCVAP